MSSLLIIKEVVFPDPFVSWILPGFCRNVNTEDHVIIVWLVCSKIGSVQKQTNKQTIYDLKKQTNKKTNFYSGQI